MLAKSVVPRGRSGYDEDVADDDHGFHVKHPPDRVEVMAKYLRKRVGHVLILLTAAATLGDPTTRADGAPIPRIYLIGDSTVKNGTKGQQGWGDPFAEHFDATKVKVDNRARGGRSSRTYFTEGLWSKLVADLHRGDVVLIQFGHNDGGSLTGGRARASIKGNGEETQEVEGPANGAKEVVHTYGWYIRKYAEDAKAKGAIPIVLSPVPRNIWKGEATVARASNDFGKWAREAALQSGVLFVDLNELVAKSYEQSGKTTVGSAYFGTDHTHTTAAGARVTAAIVAVHLKSLNGFPLAALVVQPKDIEESKAPTKALFRFDFGSGEVEPGFFKILSTSTFDKTLGYGFEPGAKIKDVDRGGPDKLREDFCTSETPFLFSVALPEGNYNVAVTLGDNSGLSTTTIKAESRRLMLEQAMTEPGRFLTRTFTVNVRTPRISGGGEVRLKSSEQGVLHWDDKLTLEFNGSQPCLCALEITQAAEAITIYLVGDSTVTDQASEPWNSWGQMLPRFFKKGVAIANHAKSGESLKSSLNARRFEKVFSTMKTGDYLFIQFGHNDMKERGPEVGAFTSYKNDLKTLVASAREHGGFPVLITSMNRKSFDANGHVVNTLGDYPEAVRQVSREEKVPLIDLHAMSKTLYEALGSTGIAKAFVDGTHHNNYGSYELARCVVEGIKQNKLGITKFLDDDVSTFDPSHPDAFDQFQVPASPDRKAKAPDGN